LVGLVWLWLGLGGLVWSWSGFFFLEDFFSRLLFRGFFNCVASINFIF